MIALGKFSLGGKIMGGISVLVVLGLFMSFYALYLFLIFISIFYLVENYIFESLFLYNKKIIVSNEPN